MLTGNQLREWRLSQPSRRPSPPAAPHLSQEDAAELLGVSAATYFNWESRGPSELPLSRESLAAIRIIESASAAEKES
jgi:transcriptional regulator with XRE-family HTH domain